MQQTNYSAKDFLYELADNMLPNEPLVLHFAKGNQEPVRTNAIGLAYSLTQHPEVYENMKVYLITNRCSIIHIYLL